MKKTFFSLMLLVAATAVSAQTLRGDLNGDDRLSSADLTILVDMIIGQTAQQSADPFAVDCARVAGTWRADGGSIFRLGADGTTTFSGATTFKYFPYERLLLLYDTQGRTVKTMVLSEVTPTRLKALDYTAGTTTAYSAVTLVSGLTMSQTALTLNSGATAQLSVTATPPDATVTAVTWSSSNTSVATVSPSGLVTAVAVGSCTITASATDGSGVSATCQVTVYIDRSGSVDGHAYVDLGLPSGTLWASCNVGASSPEDYGDYFAWGETTGYNDGKTTFSWSTYEWCNGDYNTLTNYCNNSSYGYNGFTDTKTELDPEDDAAYVNWGANWRMPSLTQFQELINSSYTTMKWTTQNGVYGRLITSNSNGNSLFLPAAGWCNDSSLDNAGSSGDCWSRTLSTNDPYDALGLYLHSGGIDTGDVGNRCYGRSVRPVRLPE